MNKHMKFCKLRVIFQTTVIIETTRLRNNNNINRLRNYFRFKDFVAETLWSNLINKFSYGSCTAYYIGKTYRHFKVRVSEHQGVSPKNR